MSNKLPASPSALPTPGIGRRLIAMVYETLLGFAVLFLPFLIFEVAVKGGHTPVLEHMRQALAFLVLGAYFIHQWSREGQTLAMRTWRLKLERPGHPHLSLQTAAVRYLLSWMWILPALILSAVLHLDKWQALGTILAGIFVWAATAFLDPQRQFLHDKLTGTRLVQLPPLPKKKKQASAT